MQFDTVHEYHFYNRDNDIYYCQDHETLIIASNGDNMNRIMIEGIKPVQLQALITRWNKEALENVADKTTSS